MPKGIHSPPADDYPLLWVSRMNTQSQERNGQSDPRSSRPRPKIILLEDRTELREGYAQSLEKAGFDVRTGVDGNELEKLLTPDVAV